MRNAGRLILGFYPLPTSEVPNLRAHLKFPRAGFSALDPCVGDGIAFRGLLEKTKCLRYGIEIDAGRAEQARQNRIVVIHGDALETRCAPESISLLYLNPPYDFEVGRSSNRRFEELFLYHTHRWLKKDGVLVFVIPQRQLERCSRLLAQEFTDIRVYRLTAAESVQYHQVAVLAKRRKGRSNQTDEQMQAARTYLDALACSENLPALTDKPEVRYSVPISEPAALSYRGLPLDAIEDLLPQSSVYVQARRLLIRQPTVLRGRPITQLHGGHVALLAASGALNGVFGEGENRHMANWSPARMYHHAKEQEEDGTVISRKWSSFSPKLLLLYEDGRTQVLEHRKKAPQADDDGQHDLAVKTPATSTGSDSAEKNNTANEKRSKTRLTSKRRIHLT